GQRTRRCLGCATGGSGEVEIGENSSWVGLTPRAASAVSRTDRRLTCTGETFPACDRLMVELVAIQSACRLAITYGWHNATIESDSKIALSPSTEVEPRWDLVAVVVNIKAWASQLPISFSWAKRECNLAAHRVAKIAFRSLNNFVWDVDFLDEITQLRGVILFNYFCEAFAFLLLKKRYNDLFL
nr:ribonuclease H protein [Tanacetum cinerariifolium]